MPIPPCREPVTVPARVGVLNSGVLRLNGMLMLVLPHLNLRTRGYQANRCFHKLQSDIEKNVPDSSPCLCTHGPGPRFHVALLSFRARSEANLGQNAALLALPARRAEAERKARAELQEKLKAGSKENTEMTERPWMQIKPLIQGQPDLIWFCCLWSWFSSGFYMNFTVLCTWFCLGFDIWKVELESGWDALCALLATSSGRNKDLAGRKARHRRFATSG